MKKSIKKRVIFRLENLTTSVIVRMGELPESLYVVEIRHNGRFRHIYKFDNSRDYEAFIFDNFGYMIIPTYQYLHEVTHLFVYR